MTKPTVTSFPHSYTKTESNIWVVNYDDIPLDRKLVRDQQVVHFSPGSVGGNHRHPRTEWFIGIGELYCVWLDENNTQHEETMFDENSLKLIQMHAYIPHAVINRSTTQFAILIEFADMKQSNVEPLVVADC